jgi:type II secretory pathway component GspD/PulD (secretin)
LDLIEQAIQVLNQAPLQIHIKARFVEISRDQKGKTGVDWYLGQSGGSNNVPVKQVSGVTGILTEPNFRVALHALQRPGFETLAEPEVTTTSGRQAQMRATQVVTVITNFALQETLTNSGVVPQTTTLETGPILDVVPRVLSDGYTINLALIPSLTEFFGYDQTTNQTFVDNAAGKKVSVPEVLPNIRVRQAVANVNVWDGQTVVLGKFESQFHGGGSIAEAKSRADDKELLVFVTASLVDPAGSRLHPSDEMPFAEKGIPPPSK